MSAAQHTAGDTVYDIQGHAYSYIGQAAGGHVVEAVYEDEDGEPHFDGPTTLREVFATPPRQKLAEDLTDLQSEIDARRTELAQVGQQIFEAQQERRVVMAKAKTDPQLTDLYLWLEGKATHIVVLDHYSVSIGPIEQMLKGNDDRDPSLRLLALYCDPKERRYGIRRSAYSDGSGNSYDPCRLATSEEHAKEIVREYLAMKLLDHNSGGWRTTWIRYAIQYGMEVSDAQREQLVQESKKNASERVSIARSMHARALADLEKAEADAKAAGAAS